MDGINCILTVCILQYSSGNVFKKRIDNLLAMSVSMWTLDYHGFPCIRPSRLLHGLQYC